MKRIDIKSFLIGVLFTTNIFFFMGFSKSQFSPRLVPDVSDNKNLMRVLKNVELELNELSRNFDNEMDEYGFKTLKKMVKQIHSEVY